MAKPSEKKVCRLKGYIPIVLETMRFTLLGRSNGSENCFLRYGSFLIKDGTEIQFWKDFWLGNVPPQKQNPALYNRVN